MGSQHLGDLIDKFKLGSRKDSILAACQNSVRLRVKAAPVAVGRSKIGGDPDLDGALPWPTSREGQALSFLAQVNLAELGNTCAREVLPAEGLLSFFYDLENEPWGYDPKHEGAWRVIHTPPGTDVIRRPPPTSIAKFEFKECSIEFEDELTLPDGDDMDALQLDKDQRENYFDLVEKYYGDGTITRMFGHPQFIQGDWRMDCQLTANGVYTGGSHYESERLAELMPGAHEWLLLFQLDSEDEADMCWGDGGRVYFAIERTALAARDFSNVWLQLQCY